MYQKGKKCVSTRWSWGWGQQPTNGETRPAVHYGYCVALWAARLQVSSRSRLSPSQSCWVGAAICSARATPFRLRAVAIVRTARCWVRATPFGIRAVDIVRAAWSGLLVAGSELLGWAEVHGQSYSVIPTQSELLGHQGQYAARSELLSAIDLKPPNSSWVIQ